MAKKTRRKTARKAVAKKAAPRKRTLNLKKVQADMQRALERMSTRGVAGATQARLQQAILEIESFCAVDQGCGTTMIVPI